jgi:hypothetical protein
LNTRPSASEADALVPLSYATGQHLLFDTGALLRQRFEGHPASRLARPQSCEARSRMVRPRGFEPRSRASPALAGYKPAALPLSYGRAFGQGARFRPSASCVRGRCSSSTNFTLMALLRQGFGGHDSCEARSAKQDGDLPGFRSPLIRSTGGPPHQQRRRPEICPPSPRLRRVVRESSEARSAK